MKISLPFRLNGNSSPAEVTTILSHLKDALEKGIDEENFGDPLDADIDQVERTASVAIFSYFSDNNTVAGAGEFGRFEPFSGVVLDIIRTALWNKANLSRTVRSFYDAGAGSVAFDTEVLLGTDDYDEYTATSAISEFLFGKDASTAIGVEGTVGVPPQINMYVFAAIEVT